MIPLFFKPIVHVCFLATAVGFLSCNRDRREPSKPTIFIIWPFRKKNIIYNLITEIITVTSLHNDFSLRPLGKETHPFLKFHFNSSLRRRNNQTQRNRLMYVS